VIGESPTVDPNAPAPIVPVIPAAPGVPAPQEVPAGCDQPITPAATFLGVVVTRDDQFAPDARSARFKVSKLEQGSLDGYELNGLVDVDFGTDYRYLTIGEAYLVTTEIDAETQRLSSRAKPEAPLFGGDQVVGINDRSDDLVCPEIVDPIITVYPSGQTIDTGVFTPLFAAKRSALERIVRPVVIALAVLALLVFIKRVVVWCLTTVRSMFARGAIQRAIRREESASAQS
jgi:hypothetical protein